MKKNWYLVAHRSGARVFEQSGVAPELVLVTSYDNPEGRMREGELNSDRGGKTPQTMGTGFNQFAPEHSQRDHLADQFSKVIATDLASKSREGKFDYLVLVAEPHLLGKLRERLDKNISEKVRATLSKDLAHVADREMSERLADVLFTREPVS